MFNFIKVYYINIIVCFVNNFYVTNFPNKLSRKKKKKIIQKYYQFRLEVRNFKKAILIDPIKKCFPFLMYLSLKHTDKLFCKKMSFTYVLIECTYHIDKLRQFQFDGHPKHVAGVHYGPDQFVVTR